MSLMVYAEEVPSVSGFDRFADAVERLLRKHYPQAKPSLAGSSSIQFEYETMDFLMHGSGKASRHWGQAFTVKGPQRGEGGDDHGGIVGSVLIERGPWEPMASVTVARQLSQGRWYEGEDDRYYFKTKSYLSPYLQSCDCHIQANVVYPDTVNPEFLEAFADLVKDVSRYLETPSSQDTRTAPQP